MTPFLRTWAGTLTSATDGRRVAVAGWADARRDHGGVVFVDLRDRTGIAQVVFDPARSGADVFAQGGALRSESVFRVAGVVRRRTPETVNPKMATGAIEIVAESVEVHAHPDLLPFAVGDESVGEETRLIHRTLDLRSPRMQEALVTRAKIVQAARRALESEGFFEIETPMLTRSTPEGARDYLVPSRTKPGCVFALPQSPQLFKQILMIGGFERYYQVVRCFRDEDLRADRQPEFTQIDIEMSFIDEEDVIGVSERMLRACFAAAGRTLAEGSIPRMTHAESLRRFGTDRPDLRIPFEIADVTDLAHASDFAVMKSAPRVLALAVPGAGDLSRSQIDDLTAFVRNRGAKGLAYFFARNNTLESNIAKYFSPELLQKIRGRTGAKDGDWIGFAADKDGPAAEVLGALRIEIAARRGLVRDEDRLVWVVDFPLLEWDAEEKRWAAKHHPFTSPRREDWERLEASPGEVLARAYDCVWNGTEIGGGSIRIHDPSLQKRLFALLGIGAQEAEAKFGFLLRSLGYGAPPHGGIAFGLDRLAQNLLGRGSIRDVIAFPKTQQAVCPLTLAPAPATERQLADLGLRTADPGPAAS